jgi:hypothetical protein
MSYRLTTSLNIKTVLNETKLMNLSLHHIDVLCIVNKSVFHNIIEGS